ncbi:hypothetical protein CHS0354_034961 [Potamilus streckersoni]|uniref:NADH dehydrogenase [ubiquinone] 1 alpha subcomplex subunit 1 n=1 Tax=Potamilus streckersoni TaxID=2493646 RepID=A0AAE0SDB5_9BIVA|nr:hypothetical protein CHS0354_034961 [Potamilus streckersoni]
MWYEILPCAAITFGCLLAPNYVHWAATKFFCNGRNHGRHWYADLHDWHSYTKDRRVTGSNYITRGLETIPDLPDDK